MIIIDTESSLLLYNYRKPPSLIDGFINIFFVNTAILFWIGFSNYIENEIDQMPAGLYLFCDPCLIPPPEGITFLLRGGLELTPVGVEKKSKLIVTGSIIFSGRNVPLFQPLSFLSFCLKSNSHLVARH
jgi:hypothetical protein